MILAPPADLPASAAVVIIGGGACGIVAALTLADAGIECVVLERDALPQGSTALSSGFIPACNTRWQRALEARQGGVRDSAELLAGDVEHKNHRGSDPLVTRAVCAVIGPALEWLADKHGIEFQVLEGFLYPGHSVARMHAVAEKNGAGLMGRLAQAAERAGVTLMTQARVTALYTDGARRVGGPGGARAGGAAVSAADRSESVGVSGSGSGSGATSEALRDRISGVRIERPDGSHEDLGCGVLLLACNGFGGNRVMVEQYIPEIAAATYAGHAGNQGDAMRWGAALGAQLADMGAYQGHGSWATPHGALVTWALMMEGGIQVNASAVRFWNEHEGYSEASQHVIAQPGGVAWNVYDERLHQLGMSFPDYAELFKTGAMKHSETLGGLASQMSMPEQAVAATVSEVVALQKEGAQRGATGGGRCPFGRDFSDKPALQAPYYAVKVTGALFHTQGGLAVDTRARVLKQDGTPFANLYAGGGAARGLSGAHVWGYLSGNGLLSAVAMGRIAAQHMAAQAFAAPATPV